METEQAILADMSEQPAASSDQFTERISALINAVEQARSVPMSSNCMINRGELLAALEELRGAVPSEMQHAQQIIDKRDVVITGGQREAERFAAEGQAEKLRLVSLHEVTRAAEGEAARILETARGEAQRLRDETESYVETSLANFEQLLQRTLEGVQLGRTRISAVVGIDAGQGFETAQDEKPLPF